jgi:hypothetical protein
MATRSAKAAAKPPKASKLAKRHAKANSSGKASKRSDRRTTLRIPKELEAEVSRVSRELDISNNQALVYLAALGAKDARRQREVRRVVERRRAAVGSPSAPDTSTVFPSPQEMREAILVDRL